MSRDCHQGVVSARSRSCSWTGEPSPAAVSSTAQPLLAWPDDLERFEPVGLVPLLPKTRRTVPHLRRYGCIASAIVRYIMNKPRTDSSRREGATPALMVKVQRQARPPTPWTWAIHKDGQSAPLRCSTRFYRSAEDAWKVGRAMLDHLPRAAGLVVPLVDQNASPDMRLPNLSPDGRDSRARNEFDMD
jgi:hypothetical protein